MAGKALKRLLMCRPEHFTVKYFINSHMKTGVDSALAVRQWEHLKDTLEKCGAKIEVMPAAAECPDLVFTVDGALVRKGVAHLSHFRHPERQAERQHFKAWFEAKGFRTVGRTDVASEGAGDAILMGDRLFAGHGFRTEFSAYESMVAALGGDLHLVECRITDPRFIHLDSVFCPLSASSALWHPAAFDDASRERVQAQGLKLLEVSRSDALNFACNTVVVGRTAVLHKGSRQTEETLTQEGFQVRLLEVSRGDALNFACNTVVVGRTAVLHKGSRQTEETLTQEGFQVRLLEVSRGDALNFACNTVVVGRTAVLHKGSRQTEETLTQEGFKVEAVDLSEFLKAGGSAKCLTLDLD